MVDAQKSLGKLPAEMHLARSLEIYIITYKTDMYTLHRRHDLSSIKVGLFLQDRKSLEMSYGQYNSILSEATVKLQRMTEL